MRKTFFLFIGLLLSIAYSYSQVVTTDPLFFTETSGAVKVIFDATKGNKGLKDFTGEVYAHTGVITSESQNNSDWKYAPQWGDNAAKYKLTSLGDNKWELTISPNIRAYYGVPAGEKVKRLALVFRSKDKKKEGKDIGNADIFIDVPEAGLNVTFVTPGEDKRETKGKTELIKFNSSSTANLELFINGASVKTASSTTELTYSYTYSSEIDYQLVAKATAGNKVVYDTVNVCVPAPVVSQPRPSGYQDGITYSADGTKATLILYAPKKENVFVIGDFSNWTELNAYQMKKDGDYWWITIDNLVPERLYGFQYLVDEEIRIADPYTELVLDPWNDKWINEHHMINSDIPSYPDGKTTGLVGVLQGKKAEYNWEVKNFKIDYPDNAVIYELLLRDFTEEKSLEAAMGKLDYLKKLGVTAIELMPIQEFDGNNSWGYNTNLYFAPDKAYGSRKMYKKFIDECHKRGMAVILDVVFNHANGLHPFALLYWDDSKNKPAADNPWMNVTAPHQHSVLNDFDHSFSKTRDYFKRVLKYWLEEYKVDGYRMDLTKGLTQNSYTENSYDQDRVNYLTEYHNAVKETNPNAMFILEHLVGGSEENTLAQKGMYLWRNVNEEYSQSAMGYQSGSTFNAMNSLPRKWVGYAESHDEERNFYKAKKYGNGSIQSNESVRLKRIALNVAFTALTPGPKMIWQFGEMGYDYSINSHGGRTEPKPVVWDWLQVPLRKEAYEKSAKAITLKRLYPKAFTEGNYQLNIGGGDWNNGRRIALTHSDLDMVMIGNFKPSGSTATYPNFSKTGVWYELLSGEELNVTNKNMTIDLPAGEVRIYTDRKVEIDNAVNDLKTVNFTIFPTVATDRLTINTDEQVKSVVVYSLEGKKVKTVLNTKTMDVTDLNSGMFLMNITTNKSQGVGKFIKR